MTVCDKAETAEAVLILANRRAEDEDEEDAGNIMRVTALKNLSPDIRIILQLLQHHNKVLYVNFECNNNNNNNVLPATWRLALFETMEIGISGS